MSLPFNHLIDLYWAQYRAAVRLYQDKNIELAADKLKTLVTNPVVPRFCRASSWMLLALCNWKNYNLAEEYLSKAETLCEEMARIEMSPKVEVYIQSTRRYQQQLEASKAVRPAVADELPASSEEEDDSARDLGVEYVDDGPVSGREELVVCFAAGSVVAEEVMPNQDMLVTSRGDKKDEATEKSESDV